MQVVTTGTVRKGRLEIRNKRTFTERIRQMRDGEVRVTIERARASRSHLQNRYYWGVVVDLLSEHTGHTPDEIHDLLKAKFLPKKLAVQDGNGEIRGEYVIGGSTAALDKVAFGEYVEAIRHWAAIELDVLIPDPDTNALWPRTHAWAS